MYDLIIKNAAVLDGTGTPFYFSDVAVKDGKIALVAKNIQEDAKEIVDAKGLYLAPGFIDAHSHHDAFLELYHDGWNNLIQGITTAVSGQCGQSPFPSGKGFEEELARVMGTISSRNFDPSVEKRGTFKNFLKTVDYPMGHHTAYHVGHGSLRAAVMGYANRKPTDEEMSKMKDMLRDAMRSGALGITYGLLYPPSSYADLDEMTEFAAVVGEFGGNFAVHIRNDGDGLIESVSEMIEIARKTGTRLVLSHQKAIFKQNWGKIKQVTEMIDKAAAEGVDVFFDVYPYTASSTTLGRFIPQELHALGRDKMLGLLENPESRAEIKARILNGRDPDEYLSDTMVGSAAHHPEYAGRFLPEIAKEQGIDACELLFNILIEERNTANGIYHRMCEEDVETAIAHPRGMLGTDGLYYPAATGLHPRAFGSFNKYLGYYVRQRKVVPLHEAIRKITSMPAAVYNLPNKGLIREGYDADLVLFDYDKIIDKATYVEPKLIGEGIEYVYVLGELAVRHNETTGVLKGTAVLRNGTKE